PGRATTPRSDTSISISRPLPASSRSGAGPGCSPTSELDRSWSRAPRSRPVPGTGHTTSVLGVDGQPRKAVETAQVIERRTGNPRRSAEEDEKGSDSRARGCGDGDGARRRHRLGGDPREPLPATSTGPITAPTRSAAPTWTSTP